MTKEPTQEQIREFWEGYDLNYCRKCNGQVTADIKPGRCNCHTPELIPIDLNNLFKYAVPKLQDKGYQVELLAYEHKGFSVSVRSVITGLWEECLGIYDDPALALFWALDKVRKEQSK